MQVCVGYTKCLCALPQYLSINVPGILGGVLSLQFPENGAQVKRLKTPLRPIYTVRFLLTIVACDFCSAGCSRHGKIVYDFYDIRLPVATIVVEF